MTVQVRWLDDEEQGAWLSLLEGWNRLAHRLDRDLKAAHDITLDDYEILAFLSFAPENRLRMSELADKLLVSRSRLTYRIDRLEQPGLVARRRCTQDGRSIWAELTDEGRALLEEAAPAHVTAVRELLIDRFDREEWLRVGERFAAVAEGLD
jgi:DNA-binding MarR family transcriptional regulator